MRCLSWKVLIGCAGGGNCDLLEPDEVAHALARRYVMMIMPQ